MSAIAPPSEAQAEPFLCVCVNIQNCLRLMILVASGGRGVVPNPCEGNLACGMLIQHKSVPHWKTCRDFFSSFFCLQRVGIRWQ